MQKKGNGSSGTWLNNSESRIFQELFRSKGRVGGYTPCCEKICILQEAITAKLSQKK